MTHRILVVEDNPTARKLFCLILQTEGYDVVEAADAGTALACVEKQPPALILQDLLLPDMHGLELLKRLRAMPQGRELPIVALSGFRSILEEGKVLPLGFDATLVKPVDHTSLLATVRSLLPRDSMPPMAARGRGRRVLLVDDDPVQAKLALLRLLGAGFEVTTAASGASALAQAVEAPPELVLSDVLMPEMDGFELCSSLRAEPGLAAVPVVLMSSHFNDEKDRMLARSVGAHALALRTPHLDEVLSAVQAALESAPSPHAAGFPESDHKQRISHRLKHVAGLNAALVQRCAQQAAQLSIVGGVADALARSADVEDVLQDVLAACLDAGGISKGALFRENADGFVVPEQCVGFNEAEREILAATFRHPALVELFRVGKPVGLSSFVDALELGPFFAQSGVSSGVFVPIMLEEQCCASLFLGSGERELVEQELIIFGRAIGAYVGQALALSSAFRRLTAAADADRVLFSSLAIDQILSALAQLVLQNLGDWCAIDLLDSGHALRNGIATHKDPAKLELAVELERRYPPRPGRSPRYSVLSAKTSLRFTETDASRVEEAEDGDHLRILRELGLRSRMMVPLLLKGRALGVLSLGSSRPGRPHGKLDLTLAEELAGRAAVALENALLYEQAQEASRSKDEFLATVSHELRTPLNAILGWARLLRSGHAPPERHQHAFEVLERNAVAQAQLIEDILDVSRIVSGKLQLAVKSVSLLGIVEAALDSLRLSLEAKDLRFDVEVDPEISINCDAERIQQVIWNVLSNAIKFTPQGGSIQVTGSATTSHVVLSVQDSGQGIGAEFIGRVFERFQQADGGFARTHGGLGLGLAISRHLVELHGGTIEASSDGAGKGALFRVTLPRSAQPHATRNVDRPLDVPPQKFERPPELSGLRVLIVDDEHDARDLLVTVLSECGATVDTARSSAEALAKLAESRQDILVSDIGMPGEDGIALISKIRAMPAERNGEIRALALSAYARAEEKKAALMAGYQMHVAKPFEPSEFVAAVATLARIAVMTK